MFNSLIAYDKSELRKKKVISASKKLFKNGVIGEEQLEKINEAYASKIYSPPVLMKLALYMLSVIALSFGLGLTALSGIIEYQFISLILGVLLLFFTEKLFIKDNFHFRSGVTEAGIYTGLSLLAYGILGFETDSVLLYLLVGFVLSAIAAVRYLDRFALLAALGFLGGIIFNTVTEIGGTTEALLPFIFFAFFALIYWLTERFERKFSDVIYRDHFTVLKYLCLILIYVSVNYYVVRELSIELMGLNLSDQNDIPFAGLFYILTICIPLGYLIWGIKNRSILFIRVALLTITLSFVTFQYYFMPNAVMAAVTVAGGFLILVAVGLFNYLKQAPSGYTSDKLLDDTLGSKNFAAIIASQTLGGNASNLSSGDAEQAGFNEGFGDGGFGGGGADSNW